MKVIITGAAGMIGKGVLWLIKKLAPGAIVDTAQIGRGMINATQKGYEKKVLTPKDILILAE